MEFNRESEVRELERQFNDSIELHDVGGKEKKREREFNPFKVKYESTRDEKIQTVEQELSRLKEMQSRVLGIQGTLGETIDKEVKKTKEKEVKEIKNKYRIRILEIEAMYREKEKEMKKEYEEKIEKIISKLKERAKEAIKNRVSEQVEEIKKSVEKKVLEVKLRDKAVIDKLSQMYIDLKEKYKRDIQKIAKQ
ncbi:hypothetical protein NEMIN01_0326 [Nematocida minor]|uniref:uncharacterized protein n=1 Tax=Nematocida minor TaxID=1912983 RepID=UPI00221E9534|nr:uncharacterized protein NEMIN01_0326 [Nematocida minor]KAI5189160.1 hypothetical protein NEMIN01_0326 [Nematocida minor]